MLMSKAKFPKTTSLSKLPASKSTRSRRQEQESGSAFDIRRLFMPNVDKIVKNVMHELSDGKIAVRETMNSALRNQEIMIAQNKRIIDLLEDLNANLPDQLTNAHLQSSSSDNNNED